MKKNIIAVSLVSAVALLANSAFAEEPKVTIGGFNTFEAGYTKSDNNWTNNSKDESVHIKIDTIYKTC